VNSSTFVRLFSARFMVALALMIGLVVGLSPGTANADVLGKSTAPFLYTRPVSSNPVATPEVAERIPYSEVKITGGTKKQRIAVRTYVRKYGTYSSIREIKLQSLDHAGTTTLYGDGSTVIKIRKSLTGTKLRQVVVHELSHAEHNWIYGGDPTAANKRFKQLFGSAKGDYGALEYAADCATHQKTGSKAYLYYKKKGCSKKMLNYAKKLSQGIKL
jgi:hypothetical protein